MEYELEELLPLAAKLAEKYTSRESSSVSYERARELMEAVLYCIREWEAEEIGKNLPKTQENGIALEDRYQKGYELVLEKASRAKEWYQKLLVDFEDYGCRNYRDTILKGMPSFFTCYDARFEPQNHILTLDYPMAVMPKDICGADIIYEYLRGIFLEKTCLDCFSVEAIRNVLERTDPDYERNYMDNICMPVLFYAVMCILLERPLDKLEVSREEILNYFKGESLESMERSLTGWIHMTVEKLTGWKGSSHLDKLGREYAVRIHTFFECKQCIQDESCKNIQNEK